MKKIIALLLALAMLLCFAGCGANEPADNSSAASSVEEAKIATVKEGKLTMATNAYFQPYEYYDGEKIVGIDAEIAEAIAKKLGLELEIQDMAFDSIITAVQEGSVDIGLAGMTVKPDRLEKVDFSVSYANGVRVVIVPNDSKIATVDDLFADDATYKAGVQLDRYAIVVVDRGAGENVEVCRQVDAHLHAVTEMKLLAAADQIHVDRDVVQFKAADA